MASKVTKQFWYSKYHNFGIESTNFGIRISLHSKANFMKIMLKIQFLIIFKISEIEQVEEQGARPPWQPWTRFGPAWA